MNPIVLVTGANGFVGQGVVDALSKSSFGVRAAVRHSGRASSLAGYEVVIGDIGPDTRWEDALIGVNRVVHLAARVHVMQDTVADPLAEFRKVNVFGTERLAREAARAGVRRFVYVSSIKINGEQAPGSYLSQIASTQIPPGPSLLKGGTLGAFSEGDEPNPQDPYGVSKWEAEQALHRVAQETGLEVVIVRPPLVYGPGVGCVPVS